jgi:hypothetical protein
MSGRAFQQSTLQIIFQRFYRVACSGSGDPQLVSGLTETLQFHNPGKEQQGVKFIHRSGPSLNLLLI